MRRDLILAAAVVASASAVDAWGETTWASTILTPLAVVAVMAVWSRRLNGDALHRAALMVGAGIIAVIAVGFALDLVPGGLTRVSWSIGLGVVAAAAVGLAGRHRRLRAHSRPTVAGMRLAGWYALSAAIVSGALVVGTISARRSDIPPLQLSIGASTASTADIVVTSPTTQRLRLVVATGRAVALWQGSIVVRAGGVFSRVVQAPTGQVTTVTLTDPQTGSTVRSLVLRRSS